MEEKAKQILLSIINNDKKHPYGIQKFQMFLVWSCKVLQNYKCLIFTSLPNSPYYELTYNGDKDEWYVDIYDKSENAVVNEYTK